MKYTEYKRGTQRRLQITIPVMLEPLVACDGTKINRTSSVTLHARVHNQSIVSLQWKVIGSIDDKGNPHWTLPKMLQDAHAAYKAYKKPAEQKALEAIIHNEPVLKASA